MTPLFSEKYLAAIEAQLAKGIEMIADEMDRRDGPAVAWRQQQAFEEANERLRNVLSWFGFQVPTRTHRGLARLVFLGNDLPVHIPWGWRSLKCYYRNAVHIMPLWLYPFARFSRDWQGIVFGRLTRLGLWWVMKDGGYWIKDGRPTLPTWLRRAWWCFLNDQDHVGEVHWSARSGEDPSAKLHSVHRFISV